MIKFVSGDLLSQISPLVFVVSCVSSVAIMTAAIASMLSVPCPSEPVLPGDRRPFCLSKSTSRKVFNDFLKAASHYDINDLKKNHLRKNYSDYKNLKLQTDY
jgi:hypothetical protein